MTHHTLAASPATTHWGYFDATLAPVLTIESGDRVTVGTVSGAKENLPPAGFHVPPELLAIHEAQKFPPPGPHILTGPIAVRGAEPGDTLEVRILDIQLRTDWGFNLIKPLAGTLPDDFPFFKQQHIALDKERMIGRLPYGLEIPLSPFFGILGVAPPPSWGRIGSAIPRAHAGNLDNKELVKGVTVFLPVYVDGGNFSCGDGHGAQGDGEVCITAIETALEGTFEIVLHKTSKTGKSICYPRAESPTHLITMGMDVDLDRCVEMALRDMITLVSERTGLERWEAYQLCSLIADLRVTQTVNVAKGVHCMVAKDLLKKVR